MYRSCVVLQEPGWHGSESVRWDWLCRASLHTRTYKANAMTRGFTKWAGDRIHFTWAPRSTYLHAHVEDGYHNVVVMVRFFDAGTGRGGGTYHIHNKLMENLMLAKHHFNSSQDVVRRRHYEILTGNYKRFKLLPLSVNWQRIFIIILLLNYVKLSEKKMLRSFACENAISIYIYVCTYNNAY